MIVFFILNFFVFHDTLYLYLYHFLSLNRTLSLSVSIYLFLSSLFVSYLPRSFCRCLSCSSLCQPSLLQIHKGDPRTCAIFIPTWAQIRGLRVFPVIKIIMVRHVHLSPESTAFRAWRWTRIKCRTAWKDRGCSCFAFVFVFGQQKSKYAQFEPHGWRRHYLMLRWYTRYGISFVYL